MTDQQRACSNRINAKTVRAALRALAGAVVLAACLASAAAFGAPATLANDADVTAFAAQVKAYAGASRVRWIIAAPTRADAEALIANVESHLATEDRPLIARVRAQTFTESPDIAPGASIPIAWMEPQIGQAQSGPKCSWQVWVTDPDAPSPAAGGVNVPLAPNDRLPVSAAATIRIGFTGLLQSKLYAFGETRPGAIRDLAAAPDVNIPVSTGPGVETILLAMARQPAPFLEGIKTALGETPGERRDLGKQFALRDNLLGRGRGIGANLQLVGPGMVLPKVEAAGTPKPDPGGHPVEVHSGDLMETCLFSLTPVQNSTQ